MHRSAFTPTRSTRHARGMSLPGHCARRGLVIAAIAGVAAFSSACDRPPTPDPGAFTGVGLSGDVRMPAMSLPSMDGGAFDLVAETEGKVALLFIGYTNCPDICPVHLANLAAVMNDLPLEITRDLVLIFVTADPVRDTPERLQTWLAAMHRRFVGLHPSREQVNALEGALQVYRSVVTPDDPNGYSVVHTGQIIAFDRDGVARAAFPWGVRQRDWRFDLPRIVAGEWPEAGDGENAFPAGTPSGAGSVEPGDAPSPTPDDSNAPSVSGN